MDGYYFRYRSGLRGEPGSASGRSSKWLQASGRGSQSTKPLLQKRCEKLHSQALPVAPKTEATTKKSSEEEEGLSVYPSCLCMRIRLEVGGVSQALPAQSARLPTLLLVVAHPARDTRKSSTAQCLSAVGPGSARPLVSSASRRYSSLIVYVVETF